MPLVRIDRSRDAPRERARIAGQAREDWSFGRGDMQYAPT